MPQSLVSLNAPLLRLQPVSVTRKMAAALPELRAAASKNGLKIHHLGAGYPHPEVTDPRAYLAHQTRYLEHLAQTQGQVDPAALTEILRESFSYTDTLGPVSTRKLFTEVYGRDWNVTMDPEDLIPTVGASGGINLMCSLFERPGTPVAYITDAPTYAGFLARSMLCQHAAIYSVEMDDQGPIMERFQAQIRQARADGYAVPFYYTVPDGHNPAGFSFSPARREAILEVARDEGVLIVEDAPYVYISYAEPQHRPQPFFAMDPAQTVHLFTASKIGFPGPRVGFAYSKAKVAINDGERTLTELLLTEASADTLFQNPYALRGFEAMLVDESFEPLPSLWPVAEGKLVVYRENRQILLDGFERNLGPHRDRFHWTESDAGFFSVLTFRESAIAVDDAFIARLVTEHGVVAIPMYDFYPPDAKRRDPRIGLDQIRVSFCFSESQGEARRHDLRQAVDALCAAVLSLSA